MLAVGLHRQLLQVGREPLEVLVVRQHGLGLRVEEVGVPDREQPQQHRQVLGERRGAEVLVHLVEAGEQLAERCPARWRSSSTSPMAESIEYRPPTQSQKPNMFMTSMPNSRHRLGVGRHRDEVLRDRRLVAQRVEHPVAGGGGVGHRLERRERLGRDDEQRLAPGSRSRVASAKSVPSTLDTKRKVSSRSV